MWRSTFVPETIVRRIEPVWRTKQTNSDELYSKLHELNSPSLVSHEKLGVWPRPKRQNFGQSRNLPRRSAWTRWNMKTKFHALILKSEIKDNVYPGWQRRFRHGYLFRWKLYGEQPSFVLFLFLFLFFLPWNVFSTYNQAALKGREVMLPGHENY